MFMAISGSLELITMPYPSQSSLLPSVHNIGGKLNLLEQINKSST